VHLWMFLMCCLNLLRCIFECLEGSISSYEWFWRFLCSLLDLITSWQGLLGYVPYFVNSIFISQVVWQDGEFHCDCDIW
jgi:hypothetical protein